MLIWQQIKESREPKTKTIFFSRDVRDLLAPIGRCELTGKNIETPALWRNKGLQTIHHRINNDSRIIITIVCLMKYDSRCTRRLIFFFMMPSSPRRDWWTEGHWKQFVIISETQFDTVGRSFMSCCHMFLIVFHNNYGPTNRMIYVYREPIMSLNPTDCAKNCLILST